MKEIFQAQNCECDPCIGIKGKEYTKKICISLLSTSK